MSEVVVVRGGHVLTMGPAGDPEAEVVGDEHGVVLPGLVNVHTHLSEGLLCGMGEDLSLLEWLAAIITPPGGT